MTVYITNYKIAQIYNVTPATVQKWIEKAIKGNLDLEVGEHEGRIKIIETAKNHQKLLVLAKNAEKYDRFKETIMEIKIPDSIYQTYNTKQLYQVIKGLRSQEVPLKYAYIGMGSELWSRFYAGTQTTNVMLSSYNFLIDSQFETIIDKFKSEDGKFSKINVVDIGCGDGSPIISLLEKLHSCQMLNAYVAIDISQHLLNKVQETLQANLTLAEVPFYSICQDFDNTLPIDTLVELSQGEEAVIPTLFVSFGGQFQNNELHEQVRIMSNIRYAMNFEDRILIINTKYNKSSIPSYAAFEKSELYDFLTWLPKEMGIIETYFTPVFEHDNASKKRSLGLKLNLPIELNFERLKKKVLLKKDQVITVWKHRREDHESVVTLGQKIDLEAELYSANNEQTAIIYMFRI
jgi:2-polyprenyl-3-methyl-5-hydroxy-6-metoxy-1,4-benzoquinol methylase